MTDEVTANNEEVNIVRKTPYNSEIVLTCIYNEMRSNYATVDRNSVRNTFVHCQKDWAMNDFKFAKLFLYIFHKKRITTFVPGKFGVSWLNNDWFTLKPALIKLYY